jgi:hypothetical protein
MSPLRTAVLGFALFALGCGAERPRPSFPPRHPGCDVTVYRGGLPEKIVVDALGQVAASCGKDAADSDCIRALQNEVCKLGGDTVYEVPKSPEPESDTALRYVGFAGRKKGNPEK